MVDVPSPSSAADRGAGGLSANVPLSRILVDLPLSLIFFSSLAVSFRYLSFYFGYQRFEFLPDPMRMPVTAFLILVTAVMMPGQKTVHGFAMSLLVYGLWLPVLVWYTFGAGAPIQVVITAMVIVVLRVFSFIVIPRPIFRPVSAGWIVSVTIAFALVLAFWALAANGISAVNFRIFQVYEFRREAAEGLPRIFQYLWPQVANAMIPLALALCLAQGRKLGFIVLCTMSVVLFAVVHHKGVLFTPFFAAIVYFLFSRRDDLLLFKLALAGAAAIGAVEAVTLELMQSNDVGLFNAMISRRVFLVPAQLDGLYLEYFSQNAKFAWATSRITFGLLENPYTTVAPFIIGETYFGSAQTSSNTGMIGAGFANAGLLGVFIYAVIIGLALCLLESHGRAVGHAIVVTASILIIHNALTATDTVTLMLTGGFGSLLLLFSILKRQG